MLSMRNLSIYVTNGYEKKKHKNAIDKIFIIFFFSVFGCISWACCVHLDLAGDTIY